ncbi:FxsA family protein [Plantactinospora soyae]|uniref:FxsA family protein n=1 Tax=Plantactinospora soyae TaxID=1544732 RepID=UPI00178988B8|nr:FxsA family protein [Plantactinospora soyae]
MRRGLRFVPLALLLTGIVEVAVFVLLGRWIGFGWTILLVVAVSVLGLVLLRREGMRAWRGFRAAAEGGRPPGPQVSDGLVGLLAGLLLALPGLVTGVVGLSLTVPLVRRLARHRVQRAAERRISAAVAGDLFGPRRVRVRRGQPRPDDPTAPPAEGPVASTGGPVPGTGGPGPAIEGEIVEPRPR